MAPWETTMRLYFPNLARPKKAAKHIARRLGLTLSTVQTALAKACGYRDWHDLAISHGSGEPSVLDQDLALEAFLERRTSVILALAQELSVPDGDVQHALADAHLTGDRAATIEDQIEQRVRCWRKTVLPDLGRRQTGAMGVIKSAGRTGEPAILRSFGQPAYTITQKNLGFVADFEFQSPRNPPPLFLPMRLYLPYGYWVEEDGAQVLFSRDYKPMWLLRPGQKPERLEPWLPIKRREQVFLSDDLWLPWQSPTLKTNLEAYLAASGVQTLPILADALPLLVQADPEQVESMAEAAELLEHSRASGFQLAT
jgi:hypothetical protein